MAEKKKKAAASSNGGSRKRRSDEEKASIVRQVLASDNRTAEMKRLGIYPNQFYSWKKLLGGKGADRSGIGRAGSAARSLADEAKAYIQGKGALLDRLRAQRAELDQLISALEG
ncbi:MAG TPA: transposase [Polyangiales bacterium]|nr:transposase [Polyangiales bacterium]